MNNTEQKLSKRIDRGFILVSSIALVILLALLSYFFIVPKFANNEPTPTPTPTANPQPEAPEDTAIKPEDENPLPSFANLDFPEVNDDKAVESVVKDNGIHTSRKSNLTLKLDEKVKLESTHDSCVVHDPTEYCMVARADLGSLNYEFFYFKDIAHTRIFRGADDIKKLNVDGVSAGASMTISYGPGEKRRVIALADKDSSGYLIVLPKSANSSDENNLMSSLTVEVGNE